MAEVVTRPEAPSGSAVDRVPPVWQPGDVLLDLYEVKQVFEGGGMGLVYRVRHRGWNIDLAVKSPRPEFIITEAHKESFEREAETWVKLGVHPHIVTCFYVRRLGTIPRVFAEYVSGGSLSDWIREKKLYEGGPDQALARILDIAIQFAWGLHHAHEQGLVHQDVKPANVLMTPDGAPLARVSDFGLATARAVSVEASASARPGRSVPVSGAGFCTPAYASPEQLEGRGLTRRTDIWSWGVSLLEMFTGEVTWASGSVAAAALELYLEAGPADAQLPPMPAALADLLRRCFRDDPDERPADMLQLAAALREIYEQVAGQPHGRQLPEPGELLADSLNNRAISLFDLNRREEADQAWQEALTVDPHHPEATYNRGLIQWRGARATGEGVLTQLQEASASCGDPGRVDYLSALIHLERHDSEAALRLLDKPGDADRPETASALALARSQAHHPVQLLRSFGDNRESIFCVAYSPDGRFALSGGGDRMVRLWLVSSGRELHAFAGHTTSVTSVAWSPDGRFALSAGSSRGRDAATWVPEPTVRLWEISSRSCLRTFQGHAGLVNSVAWSPDSRFALSGSDDRTLCRWDVAGGSPAQVFEGHAGAVHAVAWSPDGRLALSGSEDSTLALWDTLSGCCLCSLVGHTGSVTSVAWSPDGRRVISGSRDNTLQLWDVGSGRCQRTLEGHTFWVNAVVWSPDGRFLLSGGEDATLRLWEADTGRCLRTFESPTGPVTSVAWSPDGRCALSGEGHTRFSHDFGEKRLRLWGLAWTDAASPLAVSRPSSSQPLPYHRLMAQAGRAAAGGEIAAAVDLLARARQEPGCNRRPDALALAHRLSRLAAHRAFAGGWQKACLTGHAHFVTSVAWSPDGRFALSGSDDKTLGLWDIATSRCLGRFEGHTDGVESVAWSPDGQSALSGSSDQTLRLWDISSGRCLRTFEGHSRGVNAVALSPDGRWALSGSTDTTLRLWDVAGGRELRTLERHEDIITSVAWSPNGRFAFSGSGDTTVRLWEVASGRCLVLQVPQVGEEESWRYFDGFESPPRFVLSVGVSPDGRSALAGIVDNRCWRWEFDTDLWKYDLDLWEVFGFNEFTWNGLAEHAGPVYSVAVSPDGRFVLSGSGDRTFKLWEMSSRRELRTFEGHTAPVTAVAWSPDGCFALSGSNDGSLRLWELDWELERNQPADWHDGAGPWLEAFLANQVPYAARLSDTEPLTEDAITLALTREGKPAWTEADGRRLLTRLGCAGYGWLRPEGVRRELEKLAASWA